MKKNKNYPCQSSCAGCLKTDCFSKNSKLDDPIKMNYQINPKNKKEKKLKII